MVKNAKANCVKGAIKDSFRRYVGGTNVKEVPPIQTWEGIKSSDLKSGLKSFLPDFGMDLSPFQKVGLGLGL